MAIQYDLSSIILPRPTFSVDTDSAVVNYNWMEVKKYLDLEYCAGTAALTFNV